MIRPWQVLESTVLLERRWLRVAQERVRTGRGVIIDEFHVIHSPAWVGVVPVTTDERLVLVRQYRHGHGETSLELPAGVIDAGEMPVEAARRELREETGHSANSVVPLWRVRPEPARHNQWAHFAVAHGVRPAGPQNLDDEEDLEVVLWPIGELDELISQMVHGLHVAALMLAERRGLLERTP